VGPSAGARSWFCGVEAQGWPGVSSVASGRVSGRVVLALPAVVVEGATRLYSVQIHDITTAQTTRVNVVVFCGDWGKLASNSLRRRPRYGKYGYRLYSYDLSRNVSRRLGGGRHTLIDSSPWGLRGDISEVLRA
jgi:hypothetical protein